jgi:DNA polymerase-1
LILDYKKGANNMKLLALDGNSILNRAFYGIRLLTTRDGLYTNGVYGFVNILLKLLADVKPDVTAAAFDLAAPTFRHQAFDGYKAGRKKMPDELASQLPILKELLAAMGVAILEAKGFEADDILGTEAEAFSSRGDECVIATGDRDSLQLVGDRVSVLLAATKGGRPETTLYDTAKIIEEYGVSPAALLEVKALMGDSSDRIPGVEGVGQKTALSLISKFGTLDGVYGNLDSPDIRGSLRENLKTARSSPKSAGLSRPSAKTRPCRPTSTLCARRGTPPPFTACSQSSNSTRS